MKVFTVCSSSNHVIEQNIAKHIIYYHG